MKRVVLTAVGIALLWLAHAGLAHALDRADLIERLLAMGPDALIALPAAALLYAMRLALVIVAPGIAAAALAATAIDLALSRVRDRPPAPVQGPARPAE